MAGRKGAAGADANMAGAAKVAGRRLGNWRYGFSGASRNLDNGKKVADTCIYYV